MDVSLVYFGHLFNEELSYLGRRLKRAFAGHN